jgi:hypothetical protein
VDVAKMVEKPKTKFIKKAALEAKKKPKKLMADKMKAMYGKKGK